MSYPCKFLYVKACHMNNSCFAYSITKPSVFVKYSNKMFTDSTVARVMMIL